MVITAIESSKRLEDTSSDSDGGYCTPTKFAPPHRHGEVDDEAEGGLAGPAGTQDNANLDHDPPGPPEKLPHTATPEMVVVDAELRDKIVTQVEYFFSDENLAKDSFLMKHIRRNKQGYVSLKLVASFRKVKSLSKDWRVVLASLRHSKRLALSDDETKIRRVAPAPRTDSAHIRRTIIVSEYPVDQPNVKEIEERFLRYGEVSLVRILRPGKAVPPDVKPYRSKHPSLGTKLCIIVEFDSEEAARKASYALSAENCWRQEMIVKMLDETEHQPKSHLPHPQDFAAESSNGQQTREERRYRNKGKVTETAVGKQKKPLSSDNHSQHTSNKLTSPRISREDSPVVRRAAKGNNRWRKEGPSSSDQKNHLTTRESWKDYTSDSGCSNKSPSQSPKTSPGPYKKFFIGGESSWRSGEKTSTRTLQSCIIRQPHGPDGTKGFLHR